jgi:hypothetical protein
VTRLALGLAAVLLTASGPACGARPVSPEACEATQPVRQGSLLTLPADPPESSIRAVLPGPDPPRAGQAYPVRWLVDARKAGRQIRLQAAREGTGEVYRQTAEGSVSGQLAEFPSQLVFPALGCWDADVFTGTAQGSMTIKVV